MLLDYNSGIVTLKIQINIQRYQYNAVLQIISSEFDPHRMLCKCNILS